jgi:glucosyl-3-phosphoglycerate synthase
MAQDMITRYGGDAAINGLSYDRHEEESAVETFAEAIRIAGEAVAADPLGPPAVPNWARVFSAIPDFDEKLLDAVMLDNIEKERVTQDVEKAGHF